MNPNEILDNVLSASPPVILMLILNGLGVLMKRTPQIPNWAIPWALIIISAVAYPFIGEWSAVVKAARLPGAMMVCYGIGIGLAAAGFYEVALRKVLPGEPPDAPPTPPAPPKS